MKDLRIEYSSRTNAILSDSSGRFISEINGCIFTKCGRNYWNLILVHTGQLNSLFSPSILMVVKLRMKLLRNQNVTKNYAHKY
jgi:hypothetical protein